MTPKLTFERTASGESQVITASAGGEVVGAIRAWVGPESAVLRGIWVDEDHRRQGIASALLAEAKRLNPKVLLMPPTDYTDEALDELRDSEWEKHYEPLEPGKLAKPKKSK